MDTGVTSDSFCEIFIKLKIFIAGFFTDQNRYESCAISNFDKFEYEPKF